MIYNLKNDLCDEDLKKTSHFRLFDVHQGWVLTQIHVLPAARRRRKLHADCCPASSLPAGAAPKILGEVVWVDTWIEVVWQQVTDSSQGGGWGSLDYQILWFELFFVNPLSLGMGMVGLHRLHSQILKCPLASLFIHHHWSLKTCVSDFHIYYFSIHHISSSSSCWDGFAIQIRFGIHETCKTSTSKFQILQIYNSCQKIFQTYLHRLTMTHQACEWNIVKSCSQIVEVMSHLW